MKKIVDVVCPKCGTLIRVNPQNSSLVCHECGHRTEIRGESKRKEVSGN